MMLMNWKRFFLPVAAFLIIIPTILPLFRSDFFRMHDFTHVARLVELDVALKDGQIPPRWSPDFGWGFGMPLLHFYSPLPYYLEIKENVNNPHVCCQRQQCSALRSHCSSVTRVLRHSGTITVINLLHH